MTEEFKLVDDLAPSTRKLIAFIVNGNDVIAAYDAAGASAIFENIFGMPVINEDIELASDELLSTEIDTEDDRPTQTLLQMIGSIDEPQWLFSSEDD